MDKRVISDAELYNKYKEAKDQVLGFIDYFLLDHDVYTLGLGDKKHKLDDKEVRDAARAYLAQIYLEQ